MHAHHIMAVVAVILVGVSVKLVPFASPKADSPSFKGSGLDGSRLWRNAESLPAQKSQDISFIFSGGDSIAAMTSNEPRKGLFTPRCAERDLRAFGAIEEFGQIAEMPSAWLADAGLNWLQARTYCSSGAENEGVSLYDRIIAGDARMPNELRMNTRVER